eukprot:scaffold47756_cov38-Prasinocladus_malaysianus.AAC.1
MYPGTVAAAKEQHRLAKIRVVHAGLAPPVLDERSERSQACSWANHDDGMLWRGGQPEVWVLGCVN